VLAKGPTHENTFRQETAETVNATAAGPTSDYDAIHAELHSAQAQGIRLHLSVESSGVSVLDVCCLAVDEQTAGAHWLKRPSCSFVSVPSIRNLGQDHV
jgi:hypothetical protein